MPEKVILDFDNTLGLPFHEVDDGLALLYLLGKKEFDLLGVTTTFGNGSLKQVFNQTANLLADLGSEIDVYEGESRKAPGKETPASRFLVEQAQKWGKDLTIIGTGPLGNLAAASHLDPQFLFNVKRVICMGGKFHPLRIGRLDLSELNLSANPQASFQVLTSGCNLTVATGHVCTQVYLDKKAIDQFTFWSKRFRRHLKQWLFAFGAYCGTHVFYLWDLLPVVYLTKPALFEVAKMRLASNVDDLQTGKLVVGKKGDYPEVDFLVNILDLEGFMQEISSTWETSCGLYPI